MFECVMTLFVKQWVVPDSMQVGDGQDERCGVVQGDCNRNVFLERCVVSYDGSREQRCRAIACSCGAEKVRYNQFSLWNYSKSTAVRHEPTQQACT
jgi:hypothetical protein